MRAEEPIGVSFRAAWGGGPPRQRVGNSLNLGSLAPPVRPASSAPAALLAEFQRLFDARKYADALSMVSGQRMSLVAFVTDQLAIGRILDHLGLGNPEAEKPPPPLRELLRVAEHGDGWGVPQEWD